MNYTGYPVTESIKNFMYQVYGWMAGGLLLTAGTAYYVFSSKELFNYIFSNPLVLLLLIIGQFGCVIALSGFVMRMRLLTAAVTFLGYSILTGLTLSSIFYVYALSSIYLAFGVAAGTFGFMALYGYFTKDDLTGIGSIARMGLFGVIIAIFVNFFLKSPQVDYFISLIGVGVFTLLIAYDTQKIKQMGMVMLGQGQEASKVAVIAALTLYLDFINLFLFLLRLFGRQRND